jgi:UDP-glucose 4-epimerase
MKLLVTGGTGFIGSHFLRAAIAAEHEVIAVRRLGSLPRIQLEGSINWFDAEFSAINFDDLGDLKQACLVHFAAYGVSPQPCEWDLALRYNVLDSVKMLTSAVQAGVRRAVICGSCVEYGNSACRFEFIPPDAPLEPIGAYATSKAAQSIALSGLAREQKIDLAILRPFTVYGEGQHPSSFWPSLRRAAHAGDDFPMTFGDQIRDFNEVGRVANDFLSAATRKDTHPGHPIIKNVGIGNPQTLRNFAETQWREAGATGRLLLGAIPYRTNEVMRYVPKV